MARIVYIFAIVFSFIRGDVQGKAVCSNSNIEAQTALEPCITKHGLGFLPILIAFGQFKERCTDGSVERVVQCMEEIVRDCKNNDIYIDLMNYWQNRTRYVCENIQAFTDAEDCIQPSEVMRCIQKAATWVQGQQHGLITGSPEERTQVLCGFSDSIYTCTHTVYNKGCGQRTADLVTMLVRPPFCEEPSTTKQPISTVSSTQLQISTASSPAQQPISAVSSSNSNASSASASFVCSCTLKTGSNVLP